MHRLLILITCGWLAALPILTAQRVPVFRDSLALWADANRVNPAMPRGRLNAADALWKSGHEAETIAQLQLAARAIPPAPLNPHRKAGYTFLVNLELGNILINTGQPEAGRIYYLMAALTNPQLAKALSGQ